MPLDIEPTDEGLRLVGDLDISTATALREAVQGQRQRIGPLLLDASELHFMDSSGIHALIAGVRSLNGAGPLVVVNPTPPVRRVIEMCLPKGMPGLEVRA